MLTKQYVPYTTGYKPYPYTNWQLANRRAMGLAVPPHPRYQKRGTSTKTKSKSLKKNYFKYHITAFPQHEYETLRWTYFPSNQTLATGTYAELPLYINGPYDPDGPVTATQPAGWTKLTNVYTKCFVRSAKVRVLFQNLPVAAQGYSRANLVVGITITTNDTTLGSLTGAINPGLVQYTSLIGDPDSKVVEIDCDMKKFLGITSGIDAAGTYSCTSSSNPSQVVVAHVWLYNSASFTAAYNFCITVDFDCDFYDPLPVT